MRFCALSILNIILTSAIFYYPSFGNENNCSYTRHLGAIIRGDTCSAQLALVFTADTYADGADTILNVLSEHHVKASFFLTGNFYENPLFNPVIRRIVSDGHYAGAHSDKHLLYCDWSNRDSLLVSKSQFFSDIIENYRKMQPFNIIKSDAPYFLPPYEWYNQTISDWSDELGLQLVNYTPGTLSHGDYTLPGDGSNYYSSKKILDSIIHFEKTSSKGLNGFILLMHLGTHPARVDKFYFKLDALLQLLKERGYKPVRIDSLLARQ